MGINNLEEWARQPRGRCKVPIGGEMETDSVVPSRQI